MTSDQLAIPTTPASPPRAIARRSVVSWVLYDLANTVFSMNICSLYFSLYVRDVVGPERADGVFARTTALSMGLIFLLSPLLGAMTDRAPRRVPFLVVSTLICIVFTALLGRGGLTFSLACFVIANVAYQAGLQFYDALLPEVSTEENRGWIGGIGVGVGYIGSYLGVGVGLYLLHVRAAPKTAVFLATAALFLLFALPAFFWIREQGNPRAARFRPAMVSEALRGVRDTLQNAHRYPGLLRFLVGRVFYTDAINTVITVMGLYVTNLAVRAGRGAEAGERTAQTIMLAAITFAIAGGFAWGWVTDRIGPKRTLSVVLWAWVALFLAAATIGLAGLPLAVFYVVASLMGFCLGGVWAADRPYMLRLSPPERIGEFYGLYGMVGRFSAVSGPLLWSVVVDTLCGGRPELGQPMGVLSLMVLVLIGLVVLRRVTDEPRQWSGGQPRAFRRGGDFSGGASS